MRYCVAHERGWVPSNNIPSQRHPGHWHPVSRALVALALGVAKAAGCAHLIVLEPVPCDDCARAQEPGMTIPEFLTALAEVKDAFTWHHNADGRLRGARERCGQGHSPLTALAEVRTGQHYHPSRRGATAAAALGLCPEDAARITRAAALDQADDLQLAQALRQAVGVGDTAPPGHPPRQATPGPA